jgi:pSer/pThr/pTyr-binding forkhead associated (FHA) protein
MPSVVRKKIDGTVIERTELADRPVIFGRSGDADVQVHDDRISRQHFLITPADEGKYHVQDLKSTNGTWVNGQRIEDVPLKQNDKIRAGSTVWVFEEQASKGLETVMGELEQEKKGFKTLMGEISEEAK